MRIAIDLCFAGIRAAGPARFGQKHAKMLEIPNPSATIARCSGIEEPGLQTGFGRH
jgi:hypothetical protein